MESIEAVIGVTALIIYLWIMKHGHSTARAQRGKTEESKHETLQEMRCLWNI